MTVFAPQTFLLGTDGAPEGMRSARVPANFWLVLGVRPIVGRVFTFDEEKRANEQSFSVTDPHGKTMLRVALGRWLC